MAEQYDEREARKAYVRRRQQIVFSITAAILVVALVVSFLFYFRIIDVDEQVKKEEKPNYGVAVACAAKNEDGSAMAWAEPATVPVRVLNGTSSMGLAGAVKEALTDRQFNVVLADNFTSTKVRRTTIYYGVNAINPAYTLNSYFTDAVMVMDDRQDRLVDVVIGATFNDFKTDAQLKKRGSTIKDFEGCKSAEAMQKAGLPKAVKHTEVN
ncbi:LytR C-terminal domain-containing protein [Bifidobacterium sp. CP2]|uniref:LytR C-terminal domain-containing protein n=1 Tax=Bifidobacterium TaxID=1678 RepID=UPI001BDDA877|nr:MULTISPECIES: LytR C-terminal domain-containing protein [Bifidobacterium]MBT1181809.1 LytR C-terminal domain-containing protein [Bifidobacterium sp. CP2]MBW3081385.1 LytR C-terminal domain-containing protein [Bifidobacterium saguinibicoloris]